MRREKCAGSKIVSARDGSRWLFVIGHKVQTAALFASQSRADRQLRDKNEIAQFQEVTRK